ncbi:MFS transporter [Roseomonas sp. GC11]|uniref:MFS transporter n=1 Tax=Roseomonas sp. GC11 TaxID=2950546 RepID=UPI0021095684|nr:MFS transporter [Roseomonas sp. GC11]MCQ4159534.1 MFS transporter [Roseomonas sp. GC11]
MSILPRRSLLAAGATALPATLAPEARLRATPLTSTLATVLALLLGYALLQMGNTLQGSLLTMRGGIEGFSATQIGLVGSGFYLGLMIGSLRGDRLVQGVGHTRAFAALAAIASTVPLLHLMLMHPWLWPLGRAMTGFCFAGLFIVVESWLNGAASSAVRGQLLSIYGMTGMIAGVGGQMLLTAASPRGFVLFCLVSMIISFALVPVVLSRAQAPATPPGEARRLDLRWLYTLSPFGVVAAFLVGMSTASYYSLGPLFAQRMGLEAGEVAVFMACGSLGGFLATWPMGWLSDRIDRRGLIVTLTTCAAAALLAMVLLVPEHPPRPLLYAMVGTFGALVIPGYSLVLAHVNDHVPPGGFAAASGGLLVLWGAGAALGPLLGGAFMSALGNAGLGWLVLLAQSGIAGWGLWRMFRRAAPREKEDFLVMPVQPVSTTLVAVAKEAAIDRREAARS